MASGSRGNEVTIMGSNRPPFYSDAVIDSTLLAAAGTKVVTITAPNPSVGGAVVQAIASTLTIYNNSGQTCTLSITTAYNDPGANNAGIIELAPTHPITLLSGESISGWPIRAVSILETNTGAGSQTGLGVRYMVNLERFHQ